MSDINNKIDLDAYAYAYVGAVFADHTRCYASAYAYVGGEKQALRNVIYLH